VEGPSDAEFLRRILAKELIQDAEIVVAGGRRGIPSLARSVLVTRRRPIAVVIDADSNDAEMIQEQRDDMEDLIRAADSSVPVKVIAAVPAIEAWLFAAPGAIARVAGGPLSAEIVNLSKTDPKGALEHLSSQIHRSITAEDIFRVMVEGDFRQIRAIPEVIVLERFLNEARRVKAA
jgi:hypothetical protein